MRINFKIAQKWNDLTEWQVKSIGLYMFNSRNEQVSSRVFKTFIMGILLVPKFKLKYILKSIYFFTQIPLSEFEKYTDFVFDQKELFTRFPKKIKVGRWPFRKVVFGPAPRMANSTIEELSYADTFYYKWAIDQDVNDLHRLTAILYRPKSKTNNPEDVRSAFSPLTLEQNSFITDPIPLHIKFMIAHVYAGCRQNFINRNTNVFPIQKKSENSEKEEKKRKPYMPFSKIIDAFAMDEVQIFGSHQQVEKVYASKFLQIYDASIAKQREQ
ncbi:hypothetical protein AB9T89_10475 [Flavobacterium oncorhynchi]|uniref:hypothetical protein n=1 Tax=Flavobacterium oncorhynchi TaxID=728056 RepID=UPI00351A1114